MHWFKQRFSRRHRYDELSETIREHLDEKIADLMDCGMTREQAETATRREFGNITRIEERSREVWQWPTIESIWADVRLTVHQLRKSPAFTVTIIATLALGIGANTAIFTVINTILIDRLPYPESDRIVNVGRSVGGGTSEPVFSYWEQNNPAFDDLAAYHSGASTNLNGGDRPELVETVTASRNYFHLFGANPIIGRTFTPAKTLPEVPTSWS